MKNGLGSGFDLPLAVLIQAIRLARGVDGIWRRGHGCLVEHLEGDRLAFVSQAMGGSIGLPADRPIAPEILHQGIETLLPIDAPGHLTHAGAGEAGFGDLRIVDMPDNDIAALLQPEVREIGPLIQERKAKIDEVARALRDVIDPIKHRLDSVYRHDDS